MYFKKVRLVLLIILFANLAVAALKILFGLLMKSASLTADGFHSLSDGASNIVGLIGIYLSSKPIDEDHPYGHKKFETLAGFIIGSMLLFIAINIIIRSIERFISPVIPEVSLIGILVLVLTLCINIYVSIYEYKKGKKIDSQILLCDSLHTRSDIFVSIGVFVTLICVKLGMPPIIDQLASLCVAGFIIFSAYEIFKNNSEVLVDKVAVNTQDVKDIVLSFDEVKDTHNIRSRGNGNDLFIDMHIMTDPEMSVEESHYLIHNIEMSIRNSLDKNIQLIAHFEPFNENH